MTLDEKLALMREQAASKALPEYIRQNLLAQISVLEQLQQAVAAPAAVPEKEHVPFSIKRKKKEA